MAGAIKVAGVEQRDSRLHGRVNRCHALHPHRPVHRNQTCPYSRDLLPKPLGQRSPVDVLSSYPSPPEVSSFKRTHFATGAAMKRRPASIVVSMRIAAASFAIFSATSKMIPSCTVPMIRASACAGLCGAGPVLSL